VTKLGKILIYLGTTNQSKYFLTMTATMVNKILKSHNTKLKNTTKMSKIVIKLSNKNKPFLFKNKL